MGCVIETDRGNAVTSQDDQLMMEVTDVHGHRTGRSGKVGAAPLGSSWRDNGASCPVMLVQPGFVTPASEPCTCAVIKGSDREGLEGLQPKRRTLTMINGEH
jgi:hypothetical protein